ncbi:MAG: hypothetical protein OXG43_05735 [Chloroflexi bacterium]|nr:hypothetical protein [Chloroflexota bacterium]
MDVPLALLADSANISQEGKLNVLGAFDNIYAASFPAVHPAMVLVIGLTASPAEFGQTRQCRISLLDADANQLLAIEGDLEVSQPSVRAAPHSVYIPFPIPPITFPHAGDYAFHILIGDDEKATVSFRLTERSSNRSQEA